MSSFRTSGVSSRKLHRINVSFLHWRMSIPKGGNQLKKRSVTTKWRKMMHDRKTNLLMRERKTMSSFRNSSSRKLRRISGRRMSVSKDNDQFKKRIVTELPLRRSHRTYEAKNHLKAKRRWNVCFLEEADIEEPNESWKNKT